MSQEPEETGERIAEMLMPAALERINSIVAEGSRFVHYTSAAAAHSIILERKFWMRNASCMNDYLEMKFGLTHLAQAYKSAGGQRFQAALNLAFPGFNAELEQKFNPFEDAILNHTYVSCFSEHYDHEDEHGRLSMWRAYGDTAGVAIVMNNRPFVSPSDALNAWTTPVFYVGFEGLEGELAGAAERLEQQIDLVRALPKEDLLNAVFLALVFMAVSTKHIGFQEEAEWRVVHLPLVYPSTRLELVQTVLRGIPQPIFKIPLANVPEEDFLGAEIPELIDRLIIGPTQYPVAMRTSFIQALTAAGVKDAADRVVCSGVPLRV